MADGTFDVDSLADTIVSSYYNYDMGKLRISAGVDFSLPTGKSSFAIEDIGRIITDSVTEVMIHLLQLIFANGIGKTHIRSEVFAGQKRLKLFMPEV